MENCDITIVGGGSAGLAALKHLSSLGKQAILLEAGKDVGSKNVSGGILYSKKSNNGKMYNVEDIYGESFLTESPYERLITKYILNATSKDKVFSIDLTEAHNYQTNFGFSVLLNKLNSWFAKEAQSVAEKLGGGIITGVHVRSLRWDEKRSKIIVETDELEEFETKVMIAADGVNSEIAEMTNAREKFSPSELYQGVKVVVKLPEKLIEERFNITDSDEGVAYLFAGDVSLNLIGGGFLYTNRDSLSIGGVYHYNSLLKSPIEPAQIVNAMLNNPMISELVKDDVPLKEIDKTIPKEEQVRKSFAITKLISNWNEIRQIYYSNKLKKQLINDGKYKSEDEIKSKLEYFNQKLTDDSNIKFITTLLNKYGYTRLLSLIESDDVYFKGPIKIADKLGRRISSSYKPQIPTIQERVAKLSYHEDTISHIKILNSEKNFLNKMVVLCPTKCYSHEGDKVVLQHEGCIECGTYSLKTEWRHPRGEKGVFYKYG